MSQTTITIFGIIPVALGFMAIAATMKRHQKDLIGFSLSTTRSKLLKISGFALLSLVLIFNLTLINPSIGLMLWFGQLTLGALIPVFWLQRQKRNKQKQQLATFFNNQEDKIPMTTSPIQTALTTKIIFLWLFIVLGFVFHHIYGIANVYFQESMLLDGATGKTPMWAHQWRILMEGLALLFAILTLQFNQIWFRWLSLIWALLVTAFNVYHIIGAIQHESGNLSEIFILALTVLASIMLLISLNQWRKQP